MCPALRKLAVIVPETIGEISGTEHSITYNELSQLVRNFFTIDVASRKLQQTSQLSDCDGVEVYLPTYYTTQRRISA